MSTTVTLGEDVYETARAQAQISGPRPGEVLSLSVRRGQRTNEVTTIRRGPPGFKNRPGATSIATRRARELLALAWPNHQPRSPGKEWFATHGPDHWATGSFTRSGFIQRSSKPAFTAEAISPSEAAGLPQHWTCLKSHRLWTSTDAGLPLVSAGAIGQQQIDDAWLSKMAYQYSGRSATIGWSLSAPTPEQGLVEVIKT